MADDEEGKMSGRFYASGSANTTGLQLTESEDDVSGDVRAAEIASIVVPAFYLLIGVAGNVIAVVVLYRCQVCQLNNNIVALSKFFKGTDSTEQPD